LAAVASALCLVTASGAGAAPTVTEFGAGLSPGAQPWDIAAGPDGNLWFTEKAGNRIGRITPSGHIDEFTAGITGTNLEGITAGPDGNLWFTEFDRVGRITPSGVVTEFTSPITGGNLTSIAAGADGNLWFTEANSKKPYIGRVTPTGTITEFNGGLTVAPHDRGPGPYGNVWFASSGQDHIGPVTPAGTIDPLDSGIESGPGAIGAGPDANLWFARFDGVGRAAPSGAPIDAFTAGVTGHPSGGVAVGADGNLWLTEADGDNIVRATPAGTITEFPAAALSRPRDVAAGPDGNLWFTESDGNRIGRIATESPAPETGNLLRNGGAEEGAAATDKASARPVIGWATMPSFTPVAYGTPAVPSTAEAARIGGGAALFAGGPNTPGSMAIQDVDVSGHGADIDAGRASVTLSGQLGGMGTQDDEPTLAARFLDDGFDFLGGIAIAPVGPTDRGGQTGFVARSVSAQLPAGTRAVEVVASTTRAEGTYDDAYLDNLALELNVASASAGSGQGSSPGSGAGSSAGSPPGGAGGGAARCTVRVATVQPGLRNKRVLATRVACDRDATVAETATLTLPARRKRASRSAARRVALGATSAGVASGAATTVALKLARRGAAALVKAIRDHRRFTVRIAAVATTWVRLTFIWPSNSLNRSSALRALWRASSDRRPERSRLEPRPARIFSLKIGVGTRGGPA